MALRLQDVHFAYASQAPVLRGVSLQVPPGGLVVMEGRSGSGKSSLLNLAAGLLRPRRGTVEILGRSLPDDEEERAALRGDTVGLVFQHLNLLPELTVQENIALPLHFHHVPKSKQKERTLDLLKRFGLAAKRDARPMDLSGGEQQRVAIARALALEPALLLVDEPTGHLDRDNATTVIQALQEAANAGAGVLVATHDDLFAALPHRLHLEDGRLHPVAP